MESQSPVHSQLEEENQRKTRKARKQNYVQAEDEALVKAWLHIPGDAVVGRDQKSTKLWMWILQSFHEFLGRITERETQGLQNRWQTISHDVSKFCGNYNKIGRLNPSGWNDQMIIDEAKQQFGEIEGPLQTKPVQFYKFKFEHCWKILKDSPKWNDHMFLFEPHPRLEEATKIEKEKLEVKKSSEKEKWAAKKRRIEQKKMHEERKVMSQSLVGLSPDQEAYWKLQQSLIVSCYKANGFMVDKETCGNDFDFNF
ncbi:hypothetical protein Vadar_012638 [Vaccinium darrowii]|uniref:Uncharacterized protein n=1 Tax=Vaccinium darrowii TaxID=229202 RepID=A0ACB7XR47_9ERIC|nr:hypothetical protein Vadar_012638 [Vaccinium darrowii]